MCASLCPPLSNGMKYLIIQAERVHNILAQAYSKRQCWFIFDQLTLTKKARYFVDNIIGCISWKDLVAIGFRFHCDLLLKF